MPPKTRHVHKGYWMLLLGYYYISTVPGNIDDGYPDILLDLVVCYFALVSLHHALLPFFFSPLWKMIPGSHLTMRFHGHRIGNNGWWGSDGNFNLLPELLTPAIIPSAYHNITGGIIEMFNECLAWTWTTKHCISSRVVGVRGQLTAQFQWTSLFLRHDTGKDPNHEIGSEGTRHGPNRFPYNSIELRIPRGQILRVLTGWVFNCVFVLFPPAWD